MRITKQSSGGRGEYELADFAPSGENPSSLLEAGATDIHVRLNDIVFDTGVRLTNQQGKYRLRLKGTNYSQVHIQVADVLLMPHPVRDEQKITGGEPVLQNKSYLIKNLHFRQISVDEGIIEGDISTIDCANRTNAAYEINATQRMRDIQKLWKGRNKLPSEIAHLLHEHERIVTSGQPIPKRLSTLVAELQGLAESYCSDLEIQVSKRADVLPALLIAIDEVIEEQPIPLDQIEPEQIELKEREIIKWKQYARRRGPSSVKFRREVRDVYNSRCIMCGGRFPATHVNRNPGIDAAHILPWAVYDLDKVYNGIALCKLHHWAFDEGLLTINYSDDKYFVDLTEKAKVDLHLPEFSIDVLSQVIGEIPNSRLPREKSKRPNPILLQRLQEDTE